MKEWRELCRTIKKETILERSWLPDRPTDNSLENRKAYRNLQNWREFYWTMKKGSTFWDWLNCLWDGEMSEQGHDPTTGYGCWWCSKCKTEWRTSDFGYYPAMFASWIHKRK